MLPKSKNAPTGHGKSLVDNVIAKNVCTDLFLPKLCVRRWHTVVLRAPMPKTTIYKYDQFLPDKNQIRLTKHFLAQPVTQAETPENTAKHHLRRSISGTDASHLLRFSKGLFRFILTVHRKGVDISGTAGTLDGQATFTRPQGEYSMLPRISGTN